MEAGDEVEVGVVAKEGQAGFESYGSDPEVAGRDRGAAVLELNAQGGVMVGGGFGDGMDLGEGFGLGGRSRQGMSGVVFITDKRPYLRAGAIKAYSGAVFCGCKLLSRSR